MCKKKILKMVATEILDIQRVCKHKKENVVLLPMRQLFTGNKIRQ